MNQEQLDKELILKCESGTLEEVQNLIKQGANVNTEDGCRNTPLHNACRNENIDLAVIKFLVENDANVKAKGEFDCTPLHYACRNNNTNVDIIKFLVENKATVNYKDK